LLHLFSLALFFLQFVSEQESLFLWLHTQFAPWGNFYALKSYLSCIYKNFCRFDVLCISHPRFVVVLAHAGGFEECKTDLIAIKERNSTGVTPCRLQEHTPNGSHIPKVVLNESLWSLNLNVQLAENNLLLHLNM
jgi:hypothetical protein